VIHPVRLETFPLSALSKVPVRKLREAYSLSQTPALKLRSNHPDHFELDARQANSYRPQTMQCAIRQVKLRYFTRFGQTLP
jgi:hypothetical protein